MLNKTQIREFRKKFYKKGMYDIIPLVETLATYLISIGKRSNGKSFAVKHFCVFDAYKNGNLFAYVRRWDTDLKSGGVYEYFSDLNISKLTDEEYNNLQCIQSKIFLIKCDENGNIDKIQPKLLIGYYVSLNKAERFKSWAFEDCYNIIFEEFITNKIYLNNEPAEFMQLVSTILRLRKDGHVFLIGNSITRLCPYFREWQLTHALNQDIGTIDIYDYKYTSNGLNVTVQLAMERTPDNDEKQNMIIGQNRGSIVSGEWESFDLPKLNKNYNCYVKIYECLVNDCDLNYVLQLLVDEKTGECIAYVYPWSGKHKIDRIISDLPNDNYNITLGFKNIPPEILLKNLIEDFKVRFSDNLTGTDFLRICKKRGLARISYFS